MVVTEENILHNFPKDVLSEVKNTALTTQSTKQAQTKKLNAF